MLESRFKSAQHNRIYFSHILREREMETHARSSTWKEISLVKPDQDNETRDYSEYLQYAREPSQKCRDNLMHMTLYIESKIWEQQRTERANFCCARPETYIYRLHLTLRMALRSHETSGWSAPTEIETWYLTSDTIKYMAATRLWARFMIVVREIILRLIISSKPVQECLKHTHVLLTSQQHLLVQSKHTETKIKPLIINGQLQWRPWSKSHEPEFHKISIMSHL